MIPESPPLTARAHFERAIAALEAEPYTLTLFVSGASDSSAQAIANACDICDGYLEGRSHLDIVDLHQEPGLAGSTTDRVSGPQQALAPVASAVEVQARLTAAEETLRAIRNGEVDALVVQDASPAAQVFTLSSADRP